MPFPFAHPAAVLPLRRRGLVLSALVFGSIAPDFEYFFGLARPASHSMPGIAIELFGFSVIWQTFLGGGETVSDRP